MMSVMLKILITSLLMMAPAQSQCLTGQQPTKDNGCEDCPKDFFSTHGLRCIKCSSCYLGQTKLQNCSRSRDTVCLCPPTTYLRHQICEKCVMCYPGFFQKRKCAFNRNRECHMCPDGYTSNGTNAKKCFVKIVKPVPKPHDQRSNVTLYVTITLSSVAVIAVLICIIVLLILRRRKKRREAEQRNLEGGGGEEEEIPLQRLPSDTDHNSNHRKVRDLPAHIYEALGERLNPVQANNWIILAGKLDYSKSRVGLYKLHPEVATQELLNDWATGDGATVYILYNILVSMHRRDAAEIIEQEKE